TWGHRRIQGELARLGHKLAHSTVWQILTDNDIDPSPNRSDVTWTEFLKSQSAVACDFFTVDTAFLHRYYVLFFINVRTREVIFAGITANPTGPWTAQAARNLSIAHSARPPDARPLVRDRGSQFVESFDEIFRTEGFKILKTPVRVPVANSFAERWIGSIRRELLKQPTGCPEPSSGTSVRSNDSSTTTSTTTTSTAHIKHSNNGHRNQPKSRPTRRRQPSQCCEPAAATASYTNTKTPYDLGRRSFRAGQHPHRRLRPQLHPGVLRPHPTRQLDQPLRRPRPDPATRTPSATTSS
ncbi:MAG: transposase family protein, partial [Actinomycetia bacterium]|nr:transposase family protein [Actinomycetes bacterium]